jgi:beta-fructofuranosidase
MTRFPLRLPTATARRQRPCVHFTPNTGWLNDPHGIVHADGRYHMFFQYNPAGITWSPVIHWGHATSDDLIRWREEGIALSPEPGEVGCWTGSTVLDADAPTIVYTRVADTDWERGQVVLARGDASLERWHREPPQPVIGGPPEDLDVVAFRDPYVWRDAEGWKSLVGLGLARDVAAAVQYHSPDLLAWTYDGIVAQRPAADIEGTWTGTMWECPQLFELDGAWVLIVSVWADAALLHVAYALGDYDGRHFTPRRWDRFSYGDQMYATTTFLDADGRRCAISWLRERDNTAPPDSPTPERSASRTFCGSMATACSPSRTRIWPPRPAASTSCPHRR